MGFSEDELDYYSRQMVLPEIGVSGQAKLKEARVCIVGLGALGSFAALQLASMGVGNLKLVDRDVVEMSNLQRQYLYGVDVLGYLKVVAAALKLRRLNPFIEVEALPVSIIPGNADGVIEDCDVVVDGLDSMLSRYVVNRACMRLRTPFVFGAVTASIGNTSTIIPGETACLECFQGNMDDDYLPTCVHPSISNIIASVQVSEVIRIILGRPPNLANILLFCDLEDLSFDRIQVTKVDTCPVCGLIKPEK